MAINPMQRKSRNSFLLGFIISLIIGAGVSYLFYTKMSKTQEKYDSLVSLQRSVYIAKEDIKSGEEIMISELSSEYEEEDENNKKNENAIDKVKVLEKETVQTTLSEEQFIDSSMFRYYYEQNDVKDEEDEEYSKVPKKLIMKIDVPAGTIITKDMVEEVEDKTSNDQRLQEYNMLILPTLLKEGDYIDIRFQLPTSEDYIVISKKKVYKATADTIWLKMREDEILTLGNAIVEAYTITGSKLYATLYIEPGRQGTLSPTYEESEKIINLMKNDKNLINEAKEALNERYTGEQRNIINDQLSQYTENMDASVEGGVQEEITKLQTSRQQYVQSLESGSSSTTTDVE